MNDISRLSFDAVPHSFRRMAYGVPYVQLDDPSGSCMWVTRAGWPLLDHVDPAQWYADEQYQRRGQRLTGGSGFVFRVPTEGSVARPIDLVVKFSRMAQNVPVHVSSQFPADVPRHVIDEASFNDPFQEFGLLEELRHSQQGPPGLRILTKRPLAIYAPGRSFAPWQLGRSDDQFRRHYRRLQADHRQHADGTPAIDMSIDRRYIYLFQWVRGESAQGLLQQGLLSELQAADLMRRVIRELADKGFRVLDNKPGHVILRRRRDGTLLQRHGALAYVLVDFELLQRLGSALA